MSMYSIHNDNHGTNAREHPHLVHWYNCFICDLGNTCYCSIDKELELPLEPILQGCPCHSTTDSNLLRFTLAVGNS